MSEHELGQHWIRQHQVDDRDLGHVRRFGYKSYKLFEHMWDNRDFCAALLDAAPKDAIFLARDHPLSEQHSDLARDPTGTGIRHADEWQQKIDQNRFFLPIDRTYFLGINEPDDGSGDRPIEESNAARDRLDDYTAAFADRTRTHGRRIGAFNFATGKPRTIDNTDKSAPDWDYYKKRKSYNAIKAGKHMVVFHVYGSASVPFAPGHYGRIAYCDWVEIPFIVGECGIDEHVTKGGPHDGWQIALNHNAQAYAAWLDKFISGIKKLARVNIHSWQVFTYDFSHPWESFDTIPAISFFENYLWQHPKVDVDQTEPPPQPVPGDYPWVGYVSAPAGLNVRSGPGFAYQVIDALPYKARVTVYERSGDWNRIGSDRWGNKDYIEPGKPDDGDIDEGPGEPPVDETVWWEWCYAFIQKWEGGYQNNPNDIGNWTGCEIGVGINKGTNFGISACSYPDLDIINLTPQQAKEIFYRDFWVPSGASAMLTKELALLVLDTAVLHGVNAAKNWLDEVGPDPFEFAAKRLMVYVKHPKWNIFGLAWTKRVADLLNEIGGQP